jgi:shikimate dehydrogenase
MDQYAVVGNPISHSKSPLIHTLFAKQCAQELEYLKLESPLNGFLALVNDFFYGSGNDFKESHKRLGKGLNVTVPFKEQAWSLCSNLGDEAKLAGAVNTLYLNKQNEICGENTDGIGLVRDIKNQGVSFKEKKILIIGAGGAVRGVLQPILKEMPSKVVLTNRTLSKAEALVSIFSELGDVSCRSFDQLSDSFDIVINGTSASLGGELPNVSSGIFASSTVVYDMMYAKELTVFNAWAKVQGVNTVYDGLGMLVEQAAEAFYIWRGVRPKTEEVIQLLREA